jgi:hypothetical protein
MPATQCITRHKDHTLNNDRRENVKIYTDCVREQGTEKNIRTHERWSYGSWRKLLRWSNQGHHNCINGEVVNSLCLINYAPRHDDTWGTGGITPPFLTSALDGGEWSASRPGRFTPGEIAPWWAPVSVWTLWRREKSCHARNRTPTVQPVARRCADWAIRAALWELYTKFMSENPMESLRRPRQMWKNNTKKDIK